VRLEDIAVGLRRRSPWEAIDLGQAMLRQWAPRIYGTWFATYWLAGLLLLGFWPWPEYVIPLLWWLKPLFDRVLLHVCSRSLFGEACSVRDVLRELPRLLRAPGLISGLSLRRFSLARSLLLPVWQLEEQRGAAARARFALLGRRCRGHAVWLTFFCANMSTVLLLSLLLLLLALTPGEHPDWSLWDWFSDERIAGASSGRHSGLHARRDDRRAALRRFRLFALPQPAQRTRGLGHRTWSAAAGAAPRCRRRQRTTVARARPAGGRRVLAGAGTGAGGRGAASRRRRARRSRCRPGRRQRRAR
jgi:hypothetical protein